MSEEKNKTAKKKVAILALLLLTALQCYNFYLNGRIQKMVLRQVEAQHWIIQKINEMETSNE